MRLIKFILLITMLPSISNAIDFSGTYKIEYYNYEAHISELNDAQMIVKHENNMIEIEDKKRGLSYAIDLDKSINSFPPNLIAHIKNKNRGLKNVLTGINIENPKIINNMFTAKIKFFMEYNSIFGHITGIFSSDIKLKKMGNNLEVNYNQGIRLQEISTHLLGRNIKNSDTLTAVKMTLGIFLDIAAMNVWSSERFLIKLD